MNRRAGAAATVLAVAVAGCSSEPDRRYGEDDVEYKLAVVAGAGFTDESVDPYAAALDDAELACTQDREGIGDIVVRGSQVADERSIDVSILEVLAAISESVPEAMRPTDCTDIVASILVLMEA